MNELLFAYWFFWPAGVATLIPVFASRLPFLNKWESPMDFHHKWRGRRIFGDHKTWRGFLAGGLAGTFWFWVQTVIFAHSPFVRSFCSIDYLQASAIWIGVFLSFGSVIGDAIGSFFKRQLDIPSGKSWFPYDQVDFIIGGLALSAIVIRLTLFQYATIMVVWIATHLLFGVLGYIFKFKPEPL